MDNSCTVEFFSSLENRWQRHRHFLLFFNSFFHFFISSFLYFLFFLSIFSFFPSIFLLCLSFFPSFLLSSFLISSFLPFFFLYFLLLCFISFLSLLFVPFSSSFLQNQSSRSSSPASLTITDDQDVRQRSGQTGSGGPADQLFCEAAWSKKWLHLTGTELPASRRRPRRGENEGTLSNIFFSERLRRARRGLTKADRCVSKKTTAGLRKTGPPLELLNIPPMLELFMH